jgi:hypothetical protein
LWSCTQTYVMDVAFFRNKNNVTNNKNVTKGFVIIILHFSIQTINILIAVLVLTHTRYVPNNHIHGWVLFSVGGIGSYMQKHRTQYPKMVSLYLSTGARNPECHLQNTGSQQHVRSS